MNRLVLYLVSDSSGETVLSVSSAVIAQFDDLEVDKYMWPMMRSKQHLEQFFNEIKNRPGLVLYTIGDKDLRYSFIECCEKDNIPAICAISGITEKFSEYLGLKASRNIMGAKHISLDHSYFSKIDAINFAISHDDGQGMQDLKEADIALLGVSRTSKTPTSLYLAQRGFKVLNIPIVPDIKYDFNIVNLEKTLVVGLRIKPEKLIQIRKNRLLSYKVDKNELNLYTDLDEVMKEIKLADQIFNSFKLPCIDVTGKAIEETAAEIINLYYSKIGIRKTFN
jgi:regulator of PEP synthase PpsR (kinase-PPPase family)